MLKIIKGNIFTTECQTIVNTINCVGIMGAGIAFEMRLRYPEMNNKYIELCKEFKIKIGYLWLYKSNERWILNFPTKNHWKDESKAEYVELGLKKFMETYIERGITSIAFPMLGASLGGLPENVSLKIMTEYLEKCNIPVEIYRYDPSSYDDLFMKFKQQFKSFPIKELAERTRIRIDIFDKIMKAIENEKIRSMSQLLSVPGIGEKSLEKSFRFIMDLKESDTSLFDQI